MNNDVMDASAILAMLQGEPGGSVVMAAFEAGSPKLAISSVNLCEVITKLVRDGLSIEEALEAISVLREYVVDFDEKQAIRAAELYLETHAHGLSLGDRACLALAEDRKAVVWTTDRAWKKLKLGIAVKLLRG